MINTATGIVTTCNLIEPADGILWTIKDTNNIEYFIADHWLYKKKIISNIGLLNQIKYFFYPITKPHFDSLGENDILTFDYVNIEGKRFILKIKDWKFGNRS